MLSEYIRGFAKFKDFDDNLLGEIAASQEDGGFYFITFDDALCTISEAMVNDKPKALAIVTLSKDKDNFTFFDKAVDLCRDLEDNSLNLANSIVCLKEDEEIIGFFVMINLNELSQENFNTYMDNLASLSSHFVTGKAYENSGVSAKLRKEGYEIIDNLLKKSNIDPDELARNFYRLMINDICVVVQLNPYTKTITLKTLLQSRVPEKLILDAVCHNLALQGEHFFTFDRQALYLNTIVDAKNAHGDSLIDMLTVHLLLTEALTSSYKQKLDGVDYTNDGTVTDDLMQAMSRFIPV